MNYNHLNIKISEVAKQISIDGQGGPRLYQTPADKIYPSITTVLGPMKAEIIANWRARVGDKVADFESQWGKDRGTLLHDGVECVLKNRSIKDKALLIRMLIEDLRPNLLKINNIHCQEQALYSDKFEIGGRCDTIGEYDGVLSVIDFKGSKRAKRESWIEDYFLQVSYYAYAYYERTGYQIKQGVILIANAEGPAQEFIVKPWEYWTRLFEVRKAYRELNFI